MTQQTDRPRVARAGRGAEERQKAATARRVEERRAERQHRVELLADPAAGPAQADTLARVATRVDRLSRYVAGEAPPPVRTAASVTEPAAVIDAAVKRAASRLGEAGQAALHAPDATAAADRLLEAIVLTVDFVGVRYLEAGVRAARAVGRVDIFDDGGNPVGFGTGSMVSPRLLLTNNHVLEHPDMAQASQIEINFQIGLDGQRLQSVLFPFSSATVFLTHLDIDYALLPVGATADPAALAAFGHTPLIAAEGKAIVGDFVTIVQHPEGHEKQVALRENRVVDVLENFLHYSTDTQPGSSGSPVFNDQWEVVALHHAGVPDPNQVALGGVVNEGIRVSRILAHANAQNLSAEQHALLAEAQSSPPPLAARPRRADGPEAADRQLLSAPAPVAAAPGTTFHVHIPLDVAITIGAPTPAPGGPSAQGAAAGAGPALGGERVEIAPDYPDRRGYDPGFLGTGALRVPLPALPPD